MWSEASARTTTRDEDEDGVVLVWGVRVREKEDGRVVVEVGEKETRRGPPPEDILFVRCRNEEDGGVLGLVVASGRRTRTFIFFFVTEAFWKESLSLSKSKSSFAGTAAAGGVLLLLLLAFALRRRRRRCRLELEDVVPSLETAAAAG